MQAEMALLGWCKAIGSAIHVTASSVVMPGAVAADRLLCNNNTTALPRLLLIQ